MIFRVGPGQSLVLVLLLALGVTAGPVGRLGEELEQAFQEIVESTGGASDEGGGLQRSHLSVIFHDISTLFKNVANILQTDRAPSGDETGEGEDDMEEIGDERQEELGEDGEHGGEEIEQEEEPGQEEEETEREGTDAEDVELGEDEVQEEEEAEQEDKDTEDVEMREDGEEEEEEIELGEGEQEAEVQWEDNDAEDVELGEDREQEEEEVEREDKGTEDIELGDVAEDGPGDPDNAEQEAGQGGTVVNQDQGQGGQFFDEWTRRNFWLNRPRPHATPQDVIEASRQREQEGQQREQQTLKEREREQQMLEEQQQEHQMLEERQHEQQMLEEPEHEQQMLDDLEPQHEQQILDEDHGLPLGGIGQSTASNEATVGEIITATGDTNDIQPFEGSDGNRDHQPDEEHDNVEKEAGQGGIAVNQDQGQGGQIFDEWTRRNFWLNRPHPHIIPQDVIDEREEQEREQEQQMIEERQQEQQLIEERLREQQSAEERRQEQQMLEERKRERQMLEEQQREQQMLEEREREQQMLEERQPGANDVSADNENPATNDIGQPGDTGGEGSSVDENHPPLNEVDQSTVNDEAALEENNDLPPLGASGNHRPEPIASDEATGELASDPGDTSLPGGTKQWSPFDENVATMGKGGPSITIQRPPIHTGQNDDEASDEEGKSPFSGPWSPFTKNAPSFGKHPPHDHAHGPSSSGSAVGGAESQQARWADLIHNMRKPNADPFRGKWSPFDENPPPFGRHPGSIG
ncbi:uncharacterized protein LOC144867479 [Branchiostoma floridae x Branchiostoma japonicum]